MIHATTPLCFAKDANSLVGSNISSCFQGSTFWDRVVAAGVIEREGTPEALPYFAEHCDKASDYAYWFTLSTLWVSYTGFSDLELWRALFSSERPDRKRSMLKPDEVRALNGLPSLVTAYRAHRPDETDWIAYTLKPDIAFRFARERGVDQITRYAISKRAVVALFLRRGEHEILVMDKTAASPIEKISVLNLASL
jgi:hypothetical protein